MEIVNGKRIYELHDSPWINPKPVRIHCSNHKSCLFCTHCTDVWWDYTNGPYAVICNIKVKEGELDLASQTDWNENQDCPHYIDVESEE